MSEIKNWYAGKNVLITGSTGFVGKVLVERILMECVLVKCIYLIVRGKQNFEKRCEEFLNQVVFENIRKTKPEQLKKIKFLQGDISLINFGLGIDYLTEIENNVDIAIHSAADVRFDLTLRESFVANTMGTYHFLELAKRIKHLQVFVFVSTAYSQSHQKVTMEQHYESELDGKVLMKAFDRFSDTIMNALQLKILKEFPNAYSYSKHLTEDIVYQYRNDLPICIVRPSIVCGSLHYPVPGYTEGLNGLNGWGFASLRGLLRTVYCDVNSDAQHIPVDVVASTIIATSYIHGSKKLKSIEYYNTNAYLSSKVNLLEFGMLSNFLTFEYPLNYSLWRPDNVLTNCQYYYYIRMVLLQILPAVLLDLLIRILGHRPILLKSQRKIYHNANLVTPYLQNFEFDTKRFREIPNFLNETDNKTFDTRMDRVVPLNIYSSFTKGIRKFVAKEKDEDLPKARRNAKIGLLILFRYSLYWIDRIMQCVVFVYFIKFMYNYFVEKMIYAPLADNIKF